jgi:crotonobetainyl-CoA:carnitine CoA-transferase CaiB-like acyl-CoA transferase
MTGPEARHIGEFRIIEVSSSLAGALAARFALDLGASVERISSAAGRAPSAWLDDGKQVSTVAQEQLAATALQQSEHANAVIWDDIYGRLGPMPAAMRSLVPYTLELVGSHHTHGPWSEATLLAESGLAYLTGRREGPPIPLPGHQVAMLLGCHGFGALGSAVANGAAGGPAAHLRIAAVELLAGLHQFSLIDYVCNGRVRKRNGRRWANNHPIGCPTACIDGHVAVCPATDEMFFRLCVLMEQPELAEDPRFRTTTLRFENADALDEIMERYFALHTREELFTTGNELGAPVAPVLSPDEILADPNLQQRGFWTEMNGLRLPGLGLSKLPAGSVAPAAPGPKQRPLEGIRVVEFTKVWAGPLAGRALADLGAEVVRIESPFSRGPAVIPPGAAVKPAIYPDDDPGEHPWNRQGIHNILNRTRKGVCLDIKDPQARAIAFELCARADIILDNNRPGALDRSGLGYEAVAARNPSVVFVGMSGYGAANSIYRDYPAYGPVTEAMGGLVWWIRDPLFPDIPLPTGTGFPDPIVAAVAVARAAAGLNARRATGRGGFIDLSQVECTVTFLGDLLAEWQSRPADQRTWLIAFDPGDHVVELDDGRHLVTTVPGSPGGDPATSEQARHEEPQALREQGIAAAWDRSAPEVLESPELSDFWVDLDHPDVGRYRYDGNPILVVDERLPVETFPSLGADNRDVLTRWLGTTEGELDALEASGAICSSPRPPSGPG